ncbi:MAG: tyrosine protein phosphatase yvh1 [Trizodia sp. TS-e1964]|nr:MAG: tyrosine protein phosphatase yvh1 [Trizodia sp. TS-e1964]
MPFRRRAGSMSMNQVDAKENLYISGLFTLRRAAVLKAANITHVLSVLRAPLDKALFAQYKHMLVEVDDMESENLLEHFVTTNNFIQDGLAGGGGVLVHCAMGISRSATCVLAYLMQSRKLSPSQALKLLRTSRPICEPNSGFMQQLELYHRMKFPLILANEPLYQRWLYDERVRLGFIAGRAPDNICFENDAEEAHSEAILSDEAVWTEPGLEFRCRRCRMALASSEYFQAHSQNNHNISATGPHTSPTTPPSPPPVPPLPSTQSTSEPTAVASLMPISNPSSVKSMPTPKSSFSSPDCAHYFFEPLSWMRPELDKGILDGKFDCPKCSTKNVGKYAWQGMRCSCGAWIVPAISLSKGKVDQMEVAVKSAYGRGKGG